MMVALWALYASLYDASLYASALATAVQLVHINITVWSIAR